MCTYFGNKLFTAKFRIFLVLAKFMVLIKSHKTAGCLQFCCKPKKAAEKKRVVKYRRRHGANHTLNHTLTAVISRDSTIAGNSAYVVFSLG